MSYWIALKFKIIFFITFSAVSSPIFTKILILHSQFIHFGGGFLTQNNKRPTHHHCCIRPHKMNSLFPFPPYLNQASSKFIVIQYCQKKKLIILPTEANTEVSFLAKNNRPPPVTVTSLFTFFGNSDGKQREFILHSLNINYRSFYISY